MAGSCRVHEWGHELRVAAADMLQQDIDDFYMMKSNIDKRFHQDENVAVRHHSSAVTIVSSNDIPLVTSCLCESQGGCATKSDNYMKYT